MMNEEEVVLIHKTHPDWQKDKWNGIGGRIRENERPSSAMRREWIEETGDRRIHNWIEFARLKIPHGVVYFYVCTEADLPQIADMTEEHVDIFKMDELNNQPLVEYVDWLIPLARASQSLQLPIYLRSSECKTNGIPHEVQLELMDLEDRYNNEEQGVLL